MQKLASDTHIYKDEVGKYGKGLKNSNGNPLLQLTKEKKLSLTNTLFDHRLAHWTTWRAKDWLNDHHHRKLIITSIKSQWSKMKQHNTTNSQLNIQHLSDKETWIKNKETLKESLITQEKDAKPQTMWTQMTKKILSAAEYTIRLKGSDSVNRI